MAAVRIAVGAAVATCPRLVIRMGTLASMPPHPLWGLYVGNARDHVPHGKGVPVELIVRVLTCLDQGEAGVPLPECSRWTRTLCFSGWWKQRRSFRPLYVTASATAEGGAKRVLNGAPSPVKGEEKTDRHRSRKLHGPTVPHWVWTVI